MGNELTPKAYGGLKPAGSVGADEFAAHDASKAWDDASAAEIMMLSMIPEVQAYGAEQVKQAILDYALNAWADVCVVNGELCVVLDFSNDQATLAPFWKLKELLQKAIAEAENAADEPTLKAIGKFLEQMNHTFRPPVTEASRGPTRALRPGAAKPSAEGRPAGRLTAPGRAAVQRNGPGKAV